MTKMSVPLLTAIKTASLSLALLLIFIICQRICTSICFAYVICFICITISVFILTKLCVRVGFIISYFYSRFRWSRLRWVEFVLMVWLVNDVLHVTWPACLLWCIPTVLQASSIIVNYLLHTRISCIVVSITVRMSIVNIAFDIVFTFTVKIHSVCSLVIVAFT